MTNENYFLLKILEQLNKNINQQYLIIADNEQQSKKILNQLQTTIDQNILYYPAWDTLAYENLLPSPIVRSQRLSVLFKMLFNQYKIILTNYNAIMAFCPPKEFIASNILLIKVNQTLPLEQFCKNIINNGYTLAESVISPGQFAKRGSIVDLFPISQKNPCRIDWLDDTIESIRIFDPKTQKSLTTINEINAIIAHEYKTPSPYNQYSLCKLHSNLSSFTDYLTNKTKILTQSINKEQIIDNIFTNHAKSFLDKTNAVKPELIWDKNLNKKLLKFKPISSNTVEYNDIKADDKSINVFVGYDEIPNIELQKKYHNIQNLSKISFNLKPGTYYHQSNLTGSAICNKLRLINIAKNKQPIKQKHQKTHKEYNHLDAFSDLSNLKKNDYVVHQTYGIGQFAGLHTLTINNQTTELIVIKYAAEDVIYLPLYNLNMLSRYYQSSNVKLSKLGSKKWEQQKLKAKEHIDQLTSELINTYTEQQKSTGVSISINYDDYQKFYNQFPFNYTQDQDKAINDIKIDLEKNKNMDRLICGDVGFGKTEVAIHAAFIAAMSGHQVCVLAPTTVLTEQHFYSFKNRLECWGFNIKTLSRHTTSLNKKELKTNLLNGFIDIIIATHAILNNEYQFKNLGLVIIDEEHRFGVKQKELIRNFRKTSNMLALSATPIPRTLNMSLSKLRDISIIQTYPDNRLDIITQLAYIESKTVYDAIERELQRGGQIYFCMNNINKLSTIKKTLTKKFPSIEIDIVHGQMRSEEITLSMQKFKNQNTQILICTTLVESGIDIPNANTIIIYRADLMGLSQLHQLRGRVGRSNIQAFAYLCIDKDYELEKEAKLRLNALINNQKIGSGFNIAMQDLEIRGAGSLLGAKQSGIIQQIGMATYLKLLNKSISQSDTSKIEHELEVNTLMPSYIPHQYIPHEELRLEFYCKLNRCASQKQLKEFLNETEDRFGTLPEPVKNLIFIYKLKYLFNNTNILSVSIKENYYKIAISQNPKLLRRLFTNIDDKKGLIQFKEPNILKFFKAKDINNNQNLLDLLNKIITL